MYLLLHILARHQTSTFIRAALIRLNRIQTPKHTLFSVYQSTKLQHLTLSQINYVARQRRKSGRVGRGRREPAKRKKNERKGQVDKMGRGCRRRPKEQTKKRSGRKGKAGRNEE